ncbi:MAG: hypothetical protein M5U28_14895 [Sandaracinaceae bacterium]|nr:hypothetical protein [Sandaracinaceae bacterium]
MHVGEPSTRAAEAIFGGPSHLCAIAAGKVYCAGRTNFAADGPRAGGASSAPYGGGTTSRFTALTEVTGLPYVVEVADGNDHTCVRARDGAVWCWGAGRFGQVGPGSRGGTTPVAVPLEGRALELSVGHRTTCAVVEGGRLYCWGELRLGQCVEEQRDTLGQSVCFVREPSALPLDGVTDVGVGARQACALAAGSVYCFRTSTDAPAQITRVATIADALAIEVGWAHACVRTTAGAVWCWREADASPTRVTDGVAALHLGAAAGLDLLLRDRRSGAAPRSVVARRTAGGRPRRSARARGRVVSDDGRGDGRVRPLRGRRRTLRRIPLERRDVPRAVRPSMASLRVARDRRE